MSQPQGSGKSKKLWMAEGKEGKIFPFLTVDDLCTFMEPAAPEPKNIVVTMTMANGVVTIAVDGKITTFPADSEEGAPHRDAALAMYLAAAK